MGRVGQSLGIDFASRSQSYGTERRVLRQFQTFTGEMGSVRIPFGARTPRIRLRVRARDSSATTTEYLGEEITTRDQSHRDSFIKHMRSLPREVETPPRTW